MPTNCKDKRVIRPKTPTTAWPVRKPSQPIHNTPPPPAKENPLRPLFRYPGGKYRLREPILAELIRLMPGCTGYREPFIGGGAIAMNLLPNMQTGEVWLNDLDSGIAALWNSIIQYPAELEAKIQEFTPSVGTYRQFQKDLSKGFSNPKAMVGHAFRKLAVHQMSYSGLGEMAGGPLGGWKQESQYKIDSRWSPDRLVESVRKYQKMLAKLKVRVTSLDFSKVLSGSVPALVYLDPPYFQAGQVCYRNSFSPTDHERLAAALKRTNHQWVLSYDDCPEIRDLYRWARIVAIPVKYSIAGSRNESELLITKGQ